MSPRLPEAGRVIAILGRPRDSATADGHRAGGLAVLIAAAVARGGAPVELVGAVGDDPAGDAVATELGRLGIGHAALSRVPGEATPRDGSDDVPPRFEAADIELGLGYLPDISVIVTAEPLEDMAWQAILDAATFHGAAVVAIVPPGSAAPPGGAAVGTVLASPSAAGAKPAFAELVGRYAAGLAAGLEAGVAFAAARSAVGWEPIA